LFLTLLAGSKFRPRPSPAKPSQRKEFRAHCE
jgi:hypothetical protein